MSETRMPAVLVYCDGGAVEHKTKKAKIALFAKSDSGWLQLLKTNDTEMSQQIMANGKPWDRQWDRLDLWEQPIRDRYRFDCPLCRKRQGPNNTVPVLASRLEEILDRLKQNDIHEITLVALRAIV